MNKYIAKFRRDFSAAKRVLKRARKSPFFRARYHFVKWYEKGEIDPNAVLLQAYDGKDILGNLYYILKVLANAEYAHLKLYVASDAAFMEKTQATVQALNCPRVEVVRLYSRTYCKLLATAKYLLNNATFASFFIKKEGQIYLNTWHGTPLKHMGRQIQNAPNELGNTQRNMLMADYLLYPNAFTFDCMKRDYMLDNMFKGQYVLGPYPRNSAFFDAARAAEIRKALGLTGKRVIGYMPTWRGTLDNKDNEAQCADITAMLMELDALLPEDTVFYAKMHNFFSARMDFEGFKRVKPFPEGYETYEFLNVADCLVTDYSSVFFDYANTGRKIVLFAYDQEVYERERGMYMSLSELPFPIVQTPAALAECLAAADKTDYAAFQKEYCTYDCIDGAEKICELVFKGRAGNGVQIIDGISFANDKENILIMPGSLMKNGLTTAFMGILNNVDLSAYNYTVLFYRNAVNRYKQVINTFPQQTAYIPIQGPSVMTISETFAQAMYFRLNWNFGWVQKKLQTLYAREVKRLFPRLHFDYAVHYTGYERKTVHLFSAMPDTKKIMYVHSDMPREYKARRNFHWPSVEKAYQEFQGIAPIREGLGEHLMAAFNGIDPQKIHVAHNINNIEQVLEKAEQPLAFDADTVCNVELSELERILNGKSNLIFTNIARFSVEKSLDRLERAFTAFQKTHENAYLILVGGHGDCYNAVHAYAEENGNGKIIIVRSLQNPFPILKKSSALYLTSLHEGLPMTIMEALILGVPVISTDIEGPADFLRQGYGSLVENNEAGIERGMHDFAEGRLRAEKPFDAEAFNRQAIAEFYALFEKDGEVK